MRLYSTVESADNLEFSALAALESLLAVCLSLWIAWEFQTVLHIAVAACLAPFLLLRTDESTRLGLQWFEEIGKKANFNDHPSIWILLGCLIIFVPVSLYFGLIVIKWILYFTFVSTIFVHLQHKHKTLEKLPEWLALLVSVFMIPIVALTGIIGLVVGAMGIGSLTSKLIATFWSMVRAPIKSLYEMPKNWFRIVFSMDSMHPPELLPGIEKSTGNFDEIKFKEWFTDKTQQLRKNSYTDKLLGSLLLLVTPILFFPALAYRWSLKSSSIIWLPLIWIIGSKQKPENNPNLNLQSDLHHMRHSVWAYMTFGYAIIVIVFLTFIPLAMHSQAQTFQSQLASTLNGQWLNTLLNYFFAFKMEAWHWSRLAVAVLTAFAFLYADKLLLKRQFIEQAGQSSAPIIIRLLTLLRVPLSLFTIACGFWLLLSPVDWQAQFTAMQWLPSGLQNWLLSWIN